MIAVASHSEGCLASAAAEHARPPALRLRLRRRWGIGRPGCRVGLQSNA